MYVATEILGVLVEIYILHLFLQGIFAKKPHPWWVPLLSYALFGAAVAALSFVEGASILRIAVFAVWIVVLAYTLFASSLLQAIYAGVGFYAIYVLTDVGMYVLLSWLKLDSQAIMSQTNARAVYIITTHILLLGLISIVLAVTKRKRSAITLPFLLMLFPAYLLSILLGCMVCLQVQTTGEDLPVSYLIAAVALLYMNILLVFYAEKMKATADRQREYALAEQHFAMQEQYYDSLRCEQNETRAMFHDINKYMLAMKALAAKHNSEQAGQVLQEAQELFSRLGNVIDVGNSVVSIILSEYQTIAAEAEITLTFDVSVPESLTISAIDLYILLGNTLDNAVEACQKLPAGNRWIKLQLRQFHSILFYQLENPFAPDYPNRSKGKNHGFGLQNVRRVVEKHNGTLSANEADGTFTVSARLSVG